MNRRCFEKMGAPKIAQLAYKCNNWPLWMFMVEITIVGVINQVIPSGKGSQNYEKSQFLMGNQLEMAMFNSYVSLSEAKLP